MPHVELKRGNHIGAPSHTALFFKLLPLVRHPHLLTQRLGNFCFSVHAILFSAFCFLVGAFTARSLKPYPYEKMLLMLLTLHHTRAGNTTCFSVLPRWQRKLPAASYATFIRALDENSSACLYFGKHWRLQTHRGAVRLYRTGTGGIVVEMRRAAGKARLRKQLLKAHSAAVAAAADATPS